jgi:hypothetical protein
MQPTSWAALLAAAASLVFLVQGLRALRRRRVVRGAAGSLLGLLLLALAALLATLGVAAEGYRALTHEERAATVRLRPLAAQRFEADVELADGTRRSFTLAGDQFYVDARILKWHPWVNLLGIHTAYELDRIAGRYLALEDERNAPRTVHALYPERALDLFSLRQRYAWLAPLVDAEYGSATFSRADRPASYEVTVSTTGLLVREIDAAN